MKHIDSELIQKYIDKEASQEEVTCIDEHLSTCVVCRNVVDEQKNLAAEIRDVINLIGEEIVEIPVFNRPIKNRKVKRRRVMLRWSLYAASAACILFLLIFILKPEKDTPIDSVTFFHHTENEFDANRSILQQEIVVKMIDSEGNVSNFNL